MQSDTHYYISNLFSVYPVCFCLSMLTSNVLLGVPTVWRWTETGYHRKLDRRWLTNFSKNTVFLKKHENIIYNNQYLKSILSLSQHPVNFIWMVYKHTTVFSLSITPCRRCSSYSTEGFRGPRFHGSVDPRPTGPHDPFLDILFYDHNN
jgi:hypothetical protein